MSLLTRKTHSAPAFNADSIPTLHPAGNPRFSESAITVTLDASEDPLKALRKPSAEPSEEPLSTTRIDPGGGSEVCKDRTASQVWSGVR